MHSSGTTTHAFGRTLLLLAALTAAAPAATLVAQTATTTATETHPRGDIAGDWQGTLQAGKSLRAIIRITRADKGWAARFYSIDQTPQPFTVSSVTFDGTTVKCAIESVGATYTGTLSADGNTLAGTWGQGPATLPLTLIRATRETAWEIPAPAAPPKLMAADADPSFDVATIKPNDSGATTMQSLTVNGRNFATRASSLLDLMTFAYGVQARQIAGLPDWATRDRYDIAAVPDAEGAPSQQQLRSMIRKLIATRFQMKMHNEKRELSAYVLTVVKTGQKLTPTEIKGPLPGLGFRPATNGITMVVRNGTVSDFRDLTQNMLVDRPIVDQTGLTGRYDFNVTFTPDDSQFNGHPPPAPAKSDTVEPAPAFFDALQQQAGLRLDAQKTQVDVLAIDHAEKPSQN